MKSKSTCMHSTFVKSRRILLANFYARLGLIVHRLCFGVKMPKNADVLKTVFNVEHKIESFYNGGPIAVNKNGDRLFTNCADHINCIDLITGKIK